VVKTALAAEGDHSRTRMSGEERVFFIDSFTFFIVDTCVLQCYKPQKDKLFGGESPNELPLAVRE